MMGGIPLWAVGLLALGWTVALLLGLALWSSRSQRFTRVAPAKVPGLPGVMPSIEGLADSWLIDGNDVTLHQNGDGFFPALLEDVESASSSIHLEVYAWWRGEICDRLAEALAGRAQAGVEVRLLLDAFGSLLMRRRQRELMRRAGCRVELYHGLDLRNFGRLNKRDHRKLAVIDGRRGWVFGHGIAGEWEGAGDRPGSWRDTAARVRGPVIARLQSVFAQSWMEETAELIAGTRYFPPLDPVGGVRLQLISSSPRGGVSASSVMMRLLVAAARESLIIQNPYFAPNPEMVELLVDAAGRGVEVQVMVPGPVTDSRLVQYAGQRFFDALLSGGVGIYEFLPTLNHQKVMLVDDRWAYLGSANFDERSFDINAEAGLGVLDESICRQLRDAFEEDLLSSRRIELERWRRRPLRRRLREAAAFVLHEQI